jgi:hypothetical protein
MKKLFSIMILLTALLTSMTSTAHAGTSDNRMPQDPNDQKTAAGAAFKKVKQCGQTAPGNAFEKINSDGDRSEQVPRQSRSGRTTT